MADQTLTEKDLERELAEIRERYPKLKGDQLFIMWFLRAYITNDDNLAIDSLCGGPGDKGIDAILIDTDAKRVVIIQGKYHKLLGKVNEKQSDVMHFANLADVLSGDDAAFQQFCEGLRADVLVQLRKARKRVLEEDYWPSLYYVTTGKCSEKLAKYGLQVARAAHKPAHFEVVAHKRLLLILDYYLRDMAPPIPRVDLAMESGDGIVVKSILHRYDGGLDIESWVFSMTGADIADLYDRAGPRLFALNIRGYQGSTHVNEDIRSTLYNEPNYFWYYNNGITIICDAAQKITSRGRDLLRVDHPQVINGQQTTRTLADIDRGQAIKASVTVRVIRVPHDAAGNAAYFDTLVASIVKATNWQNAISASDLVSNDRLQIDIQRQLRKYGYWYVRKRQSKTEAKAVAGTQKYFMVSKIELAQAVAGCNLDPSIVRSGKEKLFEDPLYDQVFPNADPLYYLPRYWLMKSVAISAKGYPERAYAKWVVLRFLWQQLSSILTKNKIRNDFRAECEYPSDVRYYVVMAAGTVFNAALDFYRSNRGTGATAIDISGYFKRTKLDIEFDSFWNGPHNKRRTTFNNRWKKLEKSLVNLD